MNGMFGINSRAPSGRFQILNVITQGIALGRSALGSALAALWAATGNDFRTNVKRTEVFTLAFGRAESAISHPSS
jgi:hypothetical protein